VALADGFFDLGGEVFGACLVELGGLPVEVEACAGALAFVARDDVEVDMEDGLAGVGAVVLEDVVGVGAGDFHDGLGDLWERGAEGGGVGAVELVEGDDGAFGDDDGVSLAEWVDVEEGEDLVVLVDFVAGEFAGDDLGEDALGHGG